MKDTLKVACSRDFRYDVEVEYVPQFGTATAYYRGRRIYDYDSYRVNPPWGDSDADWEAYEERLQEWKDEADTQINLGAREYFDNDRQYE